ncbi:MAG: SHOCT domain-containing protein [Actinomycetota bacterium]
MMASFGGGWGGGPWIGIVWLLFWAVLVIGAVYLLRRRPHHPDPGAAALGERYARGEIDEDEYRKRLRVLREKRENR